MIILLPLIKLMIRVNKNIIIPIRLRVLPIDEMILQILYSPEKSTYFRGIPCNPAKCKGAKVMLTPMNITMNVDVISSLLKAKPVM